MRHPAPRSRAAPSRAAGRAAAGATSLEARTAAAYERWAPLYPPIAHNPLMRAEERAMRELWPTVAGGRALDLACGTGRYSRLLEATEVAELIAVDFSTPMLSKSDTAHRVRANMMRLPFADATFDVVILGLALSHAEDLGGLLSEIARVLAPGGTLLYSDFHPRAARAGLTRSFKDAEGRTCTVPHHRYGLAQQRAALRAARLKVQMIRELRVGGELRESFPGSRAFYRRFTGVPIVLVVRACK